MMEIRRGRQQIWGQAEKYDSLLLFVSDANPMLGGDGVFAIGR